MAQSEVQAVCLGVAEAAVETVSQEAQGLEAR
jgi:hypothetical protein